MGAVLVTWVIGLVATAAATAAAPGNGVIAFTDVSGGTSWISTVSPSAATPRVHRLGRGTVGGWMSDGSRLLFQSTIGGVRGWFTSRPGGTDVRRILCSACGTEAAPRDPEIFAARFSPDGDQLVARVYDSVEIVDVSTGLDGDTAFEPSRFVFEDCGAGCESASGGDWSPNGRMIAFARGDASGFANAVVGRICVYRVGPKTSTCITAPDTGDSNPAWSPDSTTIAFERLFGCADGACRSEIRTIRVGESRSRLVIQDAAQPSWSPDGKALAFVRVGRPGTCGEPTCLLGVATVRATGGGMRILTTGTHQSFPHWQPR